MKYRNTDRQAGSKYRNTDRQAGSKYRNTDRQTADDAKRGMYVGLLHSQLARSGTAPANFTDDILTI